MSNNKNNKQNRALLDTSRQRTGGMYEDFVNSNKKQFARDQEDANSLRSEIRDRYSNTNNFMPGGLKPNDKGWFDLGGMGSDSISAPNYSDVEGGYRDFANTGGVNRADFQPAFDSYRGLMSNGGIGEGEAQAFRARATGMVPAFYNKYKEALQRRSNVQGGYSPGFDAQMAEIGRESARQGFQASRDVEGDIADKRIQGRMFGTSGFGNLMSDVVGKEQQGKLAGLGGLSSIADSRAAASNANVGRNDAMQKFLLQLYSGGEQSKLAGLQQLYSSAPGNVGQTGGLYLGGLGGYSNNELGNLGMRNQIQDRSWYDYLPGLIGAGAGFMGAFGSATSGGGINNMKGTPMNYNYMPW